MKSKTYNGLDLLKFIMALFVVMIHVKPNVHSETLTTVFNPILSIAVPIFFVLSSVLIYKKLTNIDGGGYAPLVRYCKRLAILYFCWLIIDIWFVLFKRPYISDGFPEGCLEFAKDLFFGTTFPGSWFLSALLVSVVIVYVGYRTIGKYAIVCIALLISLYVSFIDLLPENLRELYEWYATNVRQEVGLSFPSQMIWVAIGLIIGINLDNILLYKKTIYPWVIGLTIVCYVLSLFWHSIFVNYVWVVSVCLFAFLIELPNQPVYERIRNYSILIFLFHFSIAGKMSLFCSLVGDSLLTNWIYYIFVVMISVIFAEMIMRLERVRYLEFLKYLH